MKKWFYIRINGTLPTGLPTSNYIIQESEVLFTTDEEVVIKFRKYFTTNDNMKKFRTMGSFEPQVPLIQVCELFENGNQTTRHDLMESILEKR